MWKSFGISRQKKLTFRRKRRFLYVLYSKYFNEKFGERNRISVFERLDENKTPIGKKRHEN